MRAAFLIAPTYEACDEFRPHLHAAYDARAVGERLLEPGYDFEVFEAPKGVEPEVWLTEILKDKGQGETDALLVYVSAVSHLDEAGELSIEVMTGRATSRLPFTKLRTAISSRGSRSVVVVLDLLMDGPMDAVVATEYTAAARRVWAPE